MTIDEAIKRLQAEKAAGIKNIVLAWWSADMFGRVDDEEWAYDAATVEENLDWSSTHDNILTTLDHIAAEEKETGA
jgi:hypothetical protein